MSRQDQKLLMKKMASKIEKVVKYLGVTLTNVNCMQFQNNYAKVRNDIKKDSK